MPNFAVLLFCSKFARKYEFLRAAITCSCIKFFLKKNKKKNHSEMIDNIK